MDNRPLVLVADRQPEFTRLVALSLGREGFRVEAAHDGLSALDKVSELNPDLLLLGVDLPESSGLRLLEELRDSHPLPVILVDEQSAASAVSAGLDQGADDFVAKPFHPHELAARVRAVLRRRRRMLGGRRKVGPALVDLDLREIEIDGRRVSIGRVEWLLLEHLISNEGRIMLHEELPDAGVGPGVPGRRPIPSLVDRPAPPAPRHPRLGRGSLSARSRAWATHTTPSTSSR